MIRRSVCLAALLTPLLAFGCGDAGRVGTDTNRVATFDEAFATTGTIRLHESDSVLNVVSYVHPDSDDGYLVADSREHRLRKYRPDGTLVWQFGREGDGPGEVRGPRVVRRLPDRSLLVGEMVQRFTVFDSLGTAPLAVHRTPFTRVEDAAVVGPDVVMISAIGAPGLEGIEGPRLHLWSPSTGEVASSFFAPLANTPVRDAGIIGGFVRLASRGDTVAATWSLADSVYLLTTRGERMAVAPLRSRFFRTPAEPPPPRNAPPAEHMRWVASFDYIGGIWWLDPDVVVVQYFELEPGDSPMDMQRRWHLVVLPLRDGPVLEVRDAPELLHVEPRDGSFTFVDPSADAPNRWLSARLRDR